MVQQAFQLISLGKYLSVDTQAPDNPLYASASDVGPNELYEVEGLTSGSSVCVIKAANGLYLGTISFTLVIGANATRDTATQFVQIFTQENEMSLILAPLEALTGLVIADTSSTPPNLIVSVPLDTAAWPNTSSLLKVTGFNQ